MCIRHDNSDAEGKLVCDANLQKYPSLMRTRSLASRCSVSEQRRPAGIWHPSPMHVEEDVSEDLTQIMTSDHFS